MKFDKKAEVKSKLQEEITMLEAKKEKIIRGIYSANNKYSETQKRKISFKKNDKIDKDNKIKNDNSKIVDLFNTKELKIKGEKVLMRRKKLISSLNPKINI